jgi:hypothetical protein
MVFVCCEAGVMHVEFGDCGTVTVTGREGRIATGGSERGLLRRARVALEGLQAATLGEEQGERQHTGWRVGRGGGEGEGEGEGEGGSVQLRSVEKIVA